MSSSRKPRDEKSTDQHIRPRSLLRSVTDHTTTELNGFSLSQGGTSAVQTKHSRKRQRSRSASPPQVALKAPKLCLNSLPPFKKKPGRSQAEMQAAASVDPKHENMHFMSEHATRMCCPDFLDALYGFEKRLEASQDNRRYLDRVIGTLRERIDASNMANAALRNTIDGLRRNINMPKNDRLVSLKEKEESDAKNVELVKANTKLVNSIGAITEENREHRLLMQIKQAEELQALKNKHGVDR